MLFVFILSLSLSLVVCVCLFSSFVAFVASRYYLLVLWVVLGRIFGHALWFRSLALLFRQCLLLEPELSAMAFSSAIGANLFFFLRSRCSTWIPVLSLRGLNEAATQDLNCAGFLTSVMITLFYCSSRPCLRDVAGMAPSPTCHNLWLRSCDVRVESLSVLSCTESEAEA